VTSLDAALAGVTRLGLDTAPVVYLVETHPRYGPLVEEVFDRLARGQFRAVTSPITLAEVLVLPLRRRVVRLQRAYQDVLLRNRYLDLFPIDEVVSARAAQLRADYRLRLSDALQLALALQASREAFLTNDLMLRRVTELRILILDELEL
jgi:predicted nucleic acid-binding protein